MSDLGRKSMADKMGDKATPDSSKSTMDKATEGLSGAGDKIAREAVPDSQKSTSQQAADKIGRSKDNNTKDGGSAGGVMDSVKHATGMDK